MKRIAFWVVLVVLSGACDRETANVLNEVESSMQAYPDSALSLIRSIDTTKLGRPAWKARYSLLHAMALDKNWIDTTDANVVMPAVEYYGAKRPLTKRAKPYYYLGRIQYNGGNYADAIISFTRANESAKSMKDARFRSLIFQAMADTYGSTYLFKDAIQYSDSSYTYCMMAGDTALAYSSLYRKAQMLNNIKQFAAADSILCFLLENESFLYPQVVPKVMADKAFVLVNQNREYESAKELFERVIARQVSSTILSDENSLVIAASDSTVINDIHGNTYWSDAENVDRITIYDSDVNTQTLMGVILHEIGHARKDYAQGANYYCNKQQRLIHESYASFIGYYLSRQYYISKGYSLTGTNYISFNGQNRQNWTYELSHASPLFVDLSDNLNQHTYLSIYVDDTISGVPISSIDQLGKNSIDLTGFINNISPLVGVYFTQSELNTMLSYYSDY